MKGLTTPAELCDDKGNVVARVLPSLNPPIYVGRECPLSQEEIERRSKNPGRLYTHDEITELLENR